MPIVIALLCLLAALLCFVVAITASPTRHAVAQSVSMYLAYLLGTVGIVILLVSLLRAIPSPFA